MMDLMVLLFGRSFWEETTGLIMHVPTIASVAIALPLIAQTWLARTLQIGRGSYRVES